MIDSSLKSGAEEKLACEAVSERAGLFAADERRDDEEAEVEVGLHFDRHFVEVVVRDECAGVRF
jgi:hypothetical protein